MDVACSLNIGNFDRSNLVRTITPSYELCTYLMYLIIIRLTSCRCVLWKWLVALGALYFTWNTTLRGSTQSTTPTLALWGTITYGLHPRSIVKDVTNLNLLSQSDDVWLFIGNYVFVALGIQSFHIWALWTPADSGGHSGCWGPLHRSSDPHWEGDWLWRWQPRYLSTSCILFLLRNLKNLICLKVD